MPSNKFSDEDWRRLADAYHEYVAPPEVVDEDPEAARRRAAAQHAIGSMRTGGRVPTEEYLLLTERWITGEISTDEMIEEAKRMWGKPE